MSASAMEKANALCASIDDGTRFFLEAQQAASFIGDAKIAAATWEFAHAVRLALDEYGRALASLEKRDGTGNVRVLRPVK